MTTAPSAAIDLEQLRPILRDLGTAEPVALAAMEGGSSLVFRVDLADGAAVILKTYDDLRQKLPVRESYAASLLRDLDVPVTRYLAVDETLTRLPFRYAITNYLPGVAVARLGAEPDIADVYREMGALLRTLHSVRLPAYGGFDGQGIVAPVASNAAFVRNIADYSLNRFRHYGGEAELAQRLEAAIADRFDVATPSSGPVFTHDDLHPNNVLAARDASGRLRLIGLIDFGNARAADPVFDLAKALFCSGHEAPGSVGPMLEGYGPIDHPDPQAALWLYTLIHRVTMWWWLRHVGIIPDGDEHPLIGDLRAMVA